jgi:hypothetical protein
MTQRQPDITDITGQFDVIIRSKRMRDARGEIERKYGWGDWISVGQVRARCSGAKQCTHYSPLIILSGQRSQ